MPQKKKKKKRKEKKKGGENARLERESITRSLFRQTEGAARESFLKWLKRGIEKEKLPNWRFHGNEQVWGFWLKNITSLHNRNSEHLRTGRYSSV